MVRPGLGEGDAGQLGVPVDAPGRLAQLEQRAKQQGNYWKNTGETAVGTPDDKNAVVFLDYTSGGTVDVKKLDDALAPFRTSGCWTNGTERSLILVVRGRDVTFNGNGKDPLRASVVVKDGGVTHGNGDFTLIGGLFADEKADLSGGMKIKLDSCAINNPPPPGNPQVDVLDYRELDRG
jgi:hypothetical protein